MSPTVNWNDRRWTVFFAAWAVLFLLSLAWVFATPMAGAPDEPSHITKAAGTVRGQLVGVPTGQEAWETFTVPRDVGEVIPPDSLCYMQKPAIPASCLELSNAADPTPVKVATQVGSYNPLYYAIVGWPSLLLHGAPALYAMRIMSALLSSFFLALTIFSLAHRTAGRPALLVGALLGLTPMTYFLAGTVNPSGAEIAGTAAVAALGWLLALEPRVRRDGPVLVLLGIAAAFVANVRATSPLYVVLAVLPPLIAGGLPLLRELFSRPFAWVVAAVTAALVAVGTAWAVLVASPAGYLPAPADHHGPVYAFARMVFFTYVYLKQAVGTLGWLDTPTPAPVVALWALAFAATAAAALLVTRGRLRLAVVVAGAAWLLTPGILEAPVAGTYGFIWQGRYMMPLLLALLVGCGFALSQPTDRVGSRLESRVRRVVNAPATAVWTAAAMSALVLLDFTIALRRNTVGTGESYLRMFTEPSWVPPGGLATAYLLAAAGIAGLILLSRRLAVPRSYLPGFLSAFSSTGAAPEVRSSR